MKIELSLFGAFRDYAPSAQVALELDDGARVADLRAALDAHGRAHWPGFNPALLQRSAFATAWPLGVQSERWRRLVLQAT